MASADVTRVVHEHVDAPEGVDGSSYGGLGVGGFKQVQLGDHRPRAESLDLFGCGLETAGKRRGVRPAHRRRMFEGRTLFDRTGADDDVKARSCEGQRAALSDPSARARDERDLVLISHSNVLSFDTAAQAVCSEILRPESASRKRHLTYGGDFRMKERRKSLSPGAGR